MKILLANYRYFISGGPERYMFNITDELERLGHNVMPFSIHYNSNLPTPYAKYFVEPLASRAEVYFNDQKMTPKTLINTFSRLFYDRKVEKAVSLMVKETQPQVAYVLHYLRKLSPAVIVGLKKNNIPVIVRLSDFGMLCPQTHCLRGAKPCTLCIKGNILYSVYYKCVKDSVIISIINFLSTLYHRKKKYFDLVDKYVVTNQFMYSMMIRAGYPDHKLAYIPTFIDTNLFKPELNSEKLNYIIYVGRIDPIKGVHVLIDAFSRLKRSNLQNPIRLKILGIGFKKYVKQLKSQVESLGLNDCVEFLGQVDALELSKIMSKALFSVVPSLCYENLPNSVLESFACGTPVIASNIGSLLCCIQDGKTGTFFKSGDAHDLAQRMSDFINNAAIAKQMCYKARDEALSYYTSDKHLQSLIDLFKTFIPKER